MNTRSKPAQRLTAFTLIELAVIILTLGLIAVTLVPAVAKSRSGTQGFRCLSNNRQLCAAWRMYAEDNSDRIPYASENISAPSSYSATWVRNPTESNPIDRGNWDPEVYITKSPLWAYSPKDATLWRCPADHSCIFVNGECKPRVRTFSMNIYVGGYGGTSGGPGSPISNYRLFLKLSDFSQPGPEKTFVLLDMRPDTIIWNSFWTDMTGYPNQPNLYTLRDLPGFSHDFGCSFSFADGRAEIHRWRDVRTAPSPNQSSDSIPSPRNQDMAWLQDHATRPR